MAITAEFFKKHVGVDPVDDDLERCNCKSAGQVGHSQCGWNYLKRKPVWHVGLDEDDTITNFLTMKNSSTNDSAQKLMLGEYDLVEAWRMIKESNTSGSDLNYHSNTHMIQVCYIAEWLMLQNNQTPSQALMLACLSHDYCHAIGEKSDAHNIETAILGLDKLFAKTKYAHLIQQASAFIKITEFPFLDENKPTTLEECVLRDADILYAVWDDVEQRANIVRKLLREMKYPDDTPIEDAFDQQIRFWSDVEMFTVQGNAIRDWFITKD